MGHLSLQKRHDGCESAIDLPLSLAPHSMVARWSLDLLLPPYPFPFAIQRGDPRPLTRIAKPSLPCTYPNVLNVEGWRRLRTVIARYLGDNNMMGSQWHHGANETLINSSVPFASTNANKSNLIVTKNFGMSTKTYGACDAVNHVVDFHFCLQVVHGVHWRMLQGFTRSQWDNWGTKHLIWHISLRC